MPEAGSTGGQYRRALRHFRHSGHVTLTFLPRVCTQRSGWGERVAMIAFSRNVLGRYSCSSAAPSQPPRKPSPESGPFRVLCVSVVG